MAQKDSVLFRNSVSGYNKADVNSYILKINSELEAAEKTAKNALEASALAQKEAEEKACALEAASASAVKQDKVISSLYEEIDTLKEEIAKLRESVKEDPAKQETGDEMLRYNEMSAQIGNVLIDAQKNAASIIDAAKKEAEKITKAASENVSEASEKALREITDKMCKSVDATYKEATAYMNALQIEVNRLLADFSGKNKEMNEKIKALHSSLSKSISSEVNELSSRITPHITQKDMNNKENV